MDVVEDHWLARIFGHTVFKVVLSPDDKPTPDSFQTFARDGGRRLDYSKVETSRIDQVRALASAGFQVVDVNITLRLDPPWPVQAVPLSISKAGRDDEAAVAEIAEKCFTFSRFHLDPSVSTAVANRIKREWVLNYFRKERGEYIYTARIDSRPVGFLAVLCLSLQNRTVGIIDLMGVHPEQQGCGIGRALVSHFIQTEGPRSTMLEVGTQAANIPSLRLYQRMGFLISRTEYVMHRHVTTNLP
jgi:GNAT superfamily N-acetyltransferase